MSEHEIDGGAEVAIVAGRIPQTSRYQYTTVGQAAAGVPILRRVEKSNSTLPVKVLKPGGNILTRHINKMEWADIDATIPAEGQKINGKMLYHVIVHDGRKNRFEGREDELKQMIAERRENLREHNLKSAMGSPAAQQKRDLAEAAAKSGEAGVNAAIERLGAAIEKLAANQAQPSSKAGKGA